MKNNTKIDQKTKDAIKKREEHIAKQLEINKERNAGFESTSLAFLLYENREYCRAVKRNRVYGNYGKNKVLEELEYKILDRERRVK